MVISTDCRISPSVASQLHGAAGLVGRKWSLVKFCNGQLMGKKLKLTQLQQIKNGSTKNVKQLVCMSLTAGVASEAKVTSNLIFSLNLTLIYTINVYIVHTYI